MVTHMKTTVEISDGLAARAKQEARAQGVTLRELIEAGLRAELDRRAKPGDPQPFRFRTVGGAGLRPGVNAEDLRELAYESAL